MSLVTTVTIISGGYGEEEQRRINKMNTYIAEHWSAEVGFKAIDSDKTAGTKYPQRNIYIGGFNYLNHPEFIDLFRSIDWPDAIMIFGYEDVEGGYTVIPSKEELVHARKYSPLPKEQDTPVKVTANSEDYR